MTEQHTSFGGLAVADPRSTTALPVDTEEAVDSANRRKLAIAGAVVAVLVVFVAAFFLMKGKGSSDNAAVPPHVTPPATTGAAQTGTTAKAAKPVHLPKSYAGVVGRDPFKALYVAPKDTGPANGSSSTTTSTGGSSVTTTPNVPTTPVTTPTGTTTGTTTPTGTTTGTTAAPGPNYVPVWVELVKVHGTSAATFVVGYTNGKRSKTVTFADIQAPTGVRTVFAQVFSLLSIQNGTVTVQVGDGTPFDLTKGFSNRHYLG